jgi:hypothetical protein
MNTKSTLQMIEDNSILRKRIKLAVSSDGNTIYLGQKRFIRLIVATLMYVMVFVMFLFACVSVTNPQYYFILPFSVAILLICLWVIRSFTRVISIDSAKHTFSISGQLRKRYVFPWSSYQGREILYSVKDYPETFYVRSQDGPLIRTVKMFDVTPVLRIYRREYYEDIMTLWDCVESDMPVNS